MAPSLGQGLAEEAGCMGETGCAIAAIYFVQIMLFYGEILMWVAQGVEICERILL